MRTKAQSVTRRRIARLIVAAACTAPVARLAPAAAAPGELKLEEAEQRICAAWEKHETVTARLMRVADFDQPAIHTHQVTDGTFKYQRRAGSPLLRMDSRITNDVVDEEKSSKYVQTQTYVVNGPVTYTLSEQQSIKIVVKTKTDERARGVGGRGLFDTLHHEYTLSLRPDATIEGSPAYVVEAAPKTPIEGSSYARSRYYFDQKSGVLVRMENIDAAGKLMDHTQYSEIVLDGPVDQAEFEFKVPADAQVIDRTQSPQGAESGKGSRRRHAASQPGGASR